VLSDVVATEGTVRARLGTAMLVHLATHAQAYASDARARDSYIALAPTDRDDGLLTMGEVRDEVAEMRADLVVLSACQTGLGDLKQAEGTVGLQRAFPARSARGVMVRERRIDRAPDKGLLQELAGRPDSGGGAAAGAAGSRPHLPAPEVLGCLPDGRRALG
jgi:hypothetical protein